MFPWRRLTQLGFISAATVVLAQSPVPSPGFQVNGGNFGTKPLTHQGAGGTFFSTLPPDSGGARFDPFMTDSLMGVGNAQRQRLVLYFTTEFQKRNVADTNRLVTLAREVNAGSSNSGKTPSPSEVRKVELIEKLARRVRERLTTP